MDYSLQHINKFGHGTLASHGRNDDEIVTIADHDGHYDVYECDSDDEAARIAAWYAETVYESYPAEIAMVMQSPRYYSVEIVEQ